MSDPWQVTCVEFDAEVKRLDLRVGFAKGARFPCPECERAGCAVKDTEQKTWRHLDMPYRDKAWVSVTCSQLRLSAGRWAAGLKARERRCCCCTAARG